MRSAGMWLGMKSAKCWLSSINYATLIYCKVSKTVFVELYPLSPDNSFI